MISGSFYTRTQGDNSGRARKGHALVAIIGIIEVPNDSELNSEGQQFAVAGHDRYFTSLDAIADHKDRFQGYGLGNIVTQAIWST